MFYPGKVLKLAPADSREDKRKMVRESFQYHFRKKYAKSFVVSSIPSTITIYQCDDSAGTTLTSIPRNGVHNR